MAGKFLGKADIRLTGVFNKYDREIVELLNDLIYYDEELDLVVIIPCGMESDGTSVSRFLWWFVNPLGREVRAAFLHDYLMIFRDSYGFSRAEVDKLFREALHDLGVMLWKRNLMWLGVRAQAFWTKDT